MTTLVQKDARNRAVRTLVQGLAFDMLAAVVLVGFTALSAAQSWGDLEWTLIGFAVVKSAGISGLSYLMRTVLDRETDIVAPPTDSGER